MNTQKINFETPVTEIMIWPVYYLSPEWTLKEAIHFFFDHRFSGAPVVDEKGQAIGVLTMKDIARYTEWHLEIEETEEEGKTEMHSEEIDDKDLSSCYHLDRIDGTTVRQIMTPNVKTLPEKATVCDVLDLMLKEHFHRVFITKEEKITGIISTIDIVRWLKLQSTNCTKAENCC